MWVAFPPYSRNQLSNCTHFRYPTDEQLLHSDILISNNPFQSLLFELQFCTAEIAHMSVLSQARVNPIWLRVNRITSVRPERGVADISMPFVMFAELHELSLV